MAVLNESHLIKFGSSTFFFRFGEMDRPLDVASCVENPNLA